MGDLAGAPCCKRSNGGCEPTLPHVCYHDSVKNLQQLLRFWGPAADKLESSGKCGQYLTKQTELGKCQFNKRCFGDSGHAKRDGLSTFYSIIGYPDVPRAEASAVLHACQTVLRNGGWICETADPDAAYAPKGLCFRPAPDGPAADLLFYTNPRTGERVDLAINGVVFCGPTYFNYGPFISRPRFHCPSCSRTIKPNDPEAEMQQQRCFDFLERYSNSVEPIRTVTCVLCEDEVEINDLVDDGPLTFIVSDVAVEFWDWPPDKVDLVATQLDKALGRIHRSGGVRI